ncbi:MAG TPA: hypothetical protein VFS38_00055 [Actinomycetota bacterium]|nr:hypothetical protein [Actinomycetota bacterium]
MMVPPVFYLPPLERGVVDHLSAPSAPPAVVGACSQATGTGGERCLGDIEHYAALAAGDDCARGGIDDLHASEGVILMEPQAVGVRRREARRNAASRHLESPAMPHTLVLFGTVHLSARESGDRRARRDEQRP